MIAWIKDNLLPFIIVSQHERGVRLRRGKYIETLDPGFYWLWPLVDEIMIIEVMPQVVDLPDKAITDKGGQTWAVSGTVEYYVEDPKKALIGVQDYDRAIQNTAVAMISRYVYNGWDKEKIEEEVADALPELAEEWGLGITDFRLNEMCKCQVYRVMGINLATGDRGNSVGFQG